MFKVTSLNFGFNFTHSETHRSQVNHSGDCGDDAGLSPKPGENHTSYLYFPAGPCEGAMLLTSLGPWGWLLWKEAWIFHVFSCMSNPRPPFKAGSPDWTCKFLVQLFSFSSLPLCTHSPFHGIGTPPGLTASGLCPYSTLHPTLHLHLGVLHNLGRTCCSPGVVRLLEPCF